MAQASACVVLIFLHPHFAQAEACATSSPFALHPYTAYPIRNQKQIQSAFVKNASYLPALTGTRARPDFFDERSCRGFNLSNSLVYVRDVVDAVFGCDIPSCVGKAPACLFVKYPNLGLVPGMKATGHTNSSPIPPAAAWANTTSPGFGLRYS